jgi:hypothetical protein
MAFTFKNPITITPYGAITRVENMLDASALEGGWSVQGGRTYSCALRVTTNSRYVGPIQVIQSLNIRMGNYYQFPMDEFGTTSPPPVGVEQDQGSFVTSIQARRETEDALSWIVSMEFSPHDLIHESGEEKLADGALNPLEKRPKVTWGSVKYEIHKSKDLDGLPFVNTAGEPLLEPPKLDENRSLLTITRNEETFSEAYVKQFRDTVNFDTFLGYPPNTVKCRDIVGDQEYDADWGMYWEVKYEFEIRDDSDTDGDGWTLVVLNAGLREKKTSGAAPTEVMMGGKPVSDPVLLNQAGLYVPGADPYYLEFHIYPEKNFADLNIPEDILTRTT